MRCFFFIDESGDSGIGRIRTANTPGASPYMTLGGALIREANLVSARNKLDEIRQKIGRELHCNTLNHQQKVFFSRELNEIKVLLFGVISRKETLGNYIDEINNRLYYNKCAQYILETLGHAAKRFKIPPYDIHIVFEKGNFDYDKLKNLVRKCQLNPIHERAKLLQYIQADNITSKEKAEESLLSLADIVAHSLFKCIDKNQNNFFIPEPRYLDEISPKFYSSKKDKSVINFGIKAVHSVKQLQLDRDIQTILSHLKSQ